MAATAYAATALIPRVMSAINYAVSSASEDDGAVRIATQCLMLGKLANECAAICERNITASEMKRAELMANEAISRVRDTISGLGPTDKLRCLMTVHEETGRVAAGSVFQKSVSGNSRPQQRIR